MKKEQFYYDKIFSDIKQEIQNGKLKIGDKIPTEFEITNKYDVSRVTAQKALNKLAKHGYIVRKRRSGSFVSDIIASSTPKANTKRELKNIALISYNADVFGGSVFFSELIKTSYKNDINISIYFTNGSIQTETEVLKNLINIKPDAILSTPLATAINIPYYEKLRINGTTVLFMDRFLPWYDAPYVSFANQKSMKQMTGWLIEKGFKNLAFCYCSEYISSEAERLKGFLSALNSNNIYLHPKNLIKIGDFADIVSKEVIEAEREKVIISSLKTFIEQNNLPDVIVCVNDITAIQVIKAAQKIGLNVPEDISVTGFEDIAAFNDFTPSITTMRQNYKVFLNIVVDTLNKLHNNEIPSCSLEIGTEIIIKESVKL